MLEQLEPQMEERLDFRLTQETNDPLGIHPLHLERDSATTNINNWRPVPSQSETPLSQPPLSQLPPSQSASHPPRRRFNAYERPEHPSRTSARIRGVEAPLVQTSVSPDRILRRRRKKRRTAWQPGVEDVIEIRSDSEEDADASGPQNSHTSLGSWNSSAMLVRNRQVIDLTRSASPPPAPSSRQRQSSSHRHRRRPVPPSPTASQSEKHPPWLRVALGRLYSDFPPVRFVIRADCHKDWEVQCQHCDPETLIGAGPGRSLGDFVAHLNATHPHLRPITNIQPQQRGNDPRINHTRNASGTRPTHDSNTQVIEGFLAKHGLSTDVAPALRAIGITDHSRMRSLGTLPDPALDRIEQGLAKQGLDLTACILIREGLRACSRAS